MWFEPPFGHDVVDFPASEGGDDRRETGKETGRTEGVFLEARFEENGVREHRRGFRDGDILEGDDEDPLLGGNREGA